MENLKSWKTTAVGVIALIGLGYETYLSGEFDATKLLLLATSLGLLVANDPNNNDKM